MVLEGVGLQAAAFSTLLKGDSVTGAFLGIL